ncbi:MAG: K+ transporter, partial [Gammaproteobacteria bacterium]
RDELFVLLHRGAASAARFYHLPPGQVIEVGAQVELSGPRRLRLSR